MNASIQTTLGPMALNALDSRGPSPAQIAAGCQSRSIAMTAIVKDALTRHYGSLKAAAIELKIDQAQLTRELQTGDFKFRRLDGDAEAKAAVSRALFEAYAGDDPKARVLRLIREGRRVFDELSEVIA